MESKEWAMPTDESSVTSCRVKKATKIIIWAFDVSKIKNPAITSKKAYTPLKKILTVKIVCILPSRVNEFFIGK